MESNERMISEAYTDEDGDEKVDVDFVEYSEADNVNP